MATAKEKAAADAAEESVAVEPEPAPVEPPATVEEATAPAADEAVELTPMEQYRALRARGVKHADITVTTNGVGEVIKVEYR